MNDQPGTQSIPLRKSSGISLKRMLIVLASLLVTAGVAVFLVDRSSGGENSAPTGQFEMDGSFTTANGRGVGPAPLKVHFKVKPINARGEVTYFWSFGEQGAKPASGPETEVDYVYKHSGWKEAIVRAHDEQGNVFLFSYIVRVVAPKDWYAKNLSPQEKQQRIVENLKAWERKFGTSIPGVSGRPAPGQRALTPESLKAQRAHDRRIARIRESHTQQLEQARREARRKAAQGQK